MTPLRSLLRERTRAAHEGVDAAFGRNDLTTRAGYASFLRRHAAALLPLEAEVERAGAERLLTDWPLRRRSEALEHDLAALDLSRPAALAAPALDGPAELLGALYVLEGSRLGAQVLVRGVERGGDPASHAATAYLRHGSGQALWPAFVAQLEQSAHAIAAPERVLAGALLAFAMFARAAEAEGD